MSKAKADKLFVDATHDVTCLVTDADAGWRTYAAGSGIDHMELNLSKKVRTKGIHHIQNVNAFHSRFKSWVRGFRGIASKYLDSYLAFFRFMDAHSSESIPIAAARLALQACLTFTPERYLDLKAPEIPLTA